MDSGHIDWQCLNTGYTGTKAFEMHFSTIFQIYLGEMLLRCKSQCRRFQKPFGFLFEENVPDMSILNLTNKTPVRKLIFQRSNIDDNSMEWGV